MNDSKCILIGKNAGINITTETNLLIINDDSGNEIINKKISDDEYETLYAVVKYLSINLHNSDVYNTNIGMLDALTKIDNNSQAFGDLSMGNDGGCSMGQDEW